MSPPVDPKFNSCDQLEKIILRYPEDPVDIRGVVIDYIGRTGKRIDEVLRMKTEIYDYLFVNSRPESAIELLQAVIRSEPEAEALALACKSIFPEIAKLVNEIGRHRSVSTPIGDEFFIKTQDYLGHSVDVVFWQISDLHFGKYNLLESDPRDLAATLAKAAEKYSMLRPDLILISGDVSSVATKKEFNEFIIFCKSVSEFLGGSKSAPPILVVPGNHDISWEADGSADRMEAFRLHFSENKCCISPFGPDEETIEDSRITVKRYNPSPTTTPPFAVVALQNADVEFVLLVSGYFSGNVPAEVRKAVMDSPSKERLHELLRADEGSVNREYILNLTRMPRSTAKARLGVIHHNPVPYGIETCANHFAAQLLETLFERDTRILLHGHVHLTEDIASARPVSPHRAYPVPCPTLTSFPASGERGMNVGIIGSDGVDKLLSVLTWGLSTSSDFKQEGLRLRYSMKLSGTELEVTHGTRYPER